MINKSSCFIDALQIVYGIDAHRIHFRYKEIAPDSIPEEVGYHPSVTNLVLMELFGFCLVQIDPVPADGNDTPVTSGQLPVGPILSGACVVQGPQAGHGEHALAFMPDGRVIDPATGKEFQGTPCVRTAWVVSRYEQVQ